MNEDARKAEITALGAALAQAEGYRDMLALTNTPTDVVERSRSLLEYERACAQARNARWALEKALNDAEAKG